MTLTATIFALVQGCTSPTGATSDWLEATAGETVDRVARALSKLRTQKKVFGTRGYGEQHYFTSPEAIEAARPAIEAHSAIKRAAAIEAQREYQRARWVPKPARPPKPKSPKAMTVKLPVPVGSIATPKAGGPARMPGELVITAATKITVAPPPAARVYRTNTYPTY